MTRKKKRMSKDASAKMRMSKHERANNLAKELVAEEEDVKEKQRQQEQAAGKGRQKGKGKEQVVAATEPKPFLCKSMTEDVVCMNFAAYKELSVADDMSKAEQSSTTPRLWHVDQEWEELPGHLGLTSAAGTKDEQHVYEHSGAQGLASTLVEEEEELKEQSQVEYSGGPQRVVEQGLASTTYVEEELKEQPQVVGGPKHAAGAVQEASTLLQNKGDKAAMKELWAALCSIATGMLRYIEGTNARLDSIDSRLDGIVLRLDGNDSRFDNIDNLCAQLNHKLEDVGKSTMHLNAAVSLLTERSSRSSIRSLFQSLIPGARVLLPMTNKVLPYQAIAQLEKLGELCSQPSVYGSKMRPHPTPKFAEMDVLLKVLQEGSMVDEADSPEVGRVHTTSVDENVGQRLHHIVIGEVTRSRYLCTSASDYRHPQKLSDTPSTKLLYKFVQLERGIQAAMTYYAISLDSVQGGVLVSPSFMELSEPKRLVAKVLHHSLALAAVRELHKRGRIWLVDI